MASYEGQAKDLYYLDEPAGSFDQDLVNALDVGVRHTVNQALAQVIQPTKHHLFGFVEQQGCVAPSGIQPIGEPPLPTNTQASKQSTNPHSADFESLIRNMAREHDYNSGSQKKAVSNPASSFSDQSSEQGDDPPRKSKKKVHHQEAPTPKVLTSEPEDIVHRSGCGNEEPEHTEATVPLLRLFGGTRRFLAYAASPFPWRRALEELFTPSKHHIVQDATSRFPGDTCGSNLSITVDRQCRPLDAASPFPCRRVQTKRFPLELASPFLWRRMRKQQSLLALVRTPPLCRSQRGNGKIGRGAQASRSSPTSSPNCSGCDNEEPEHTEVNLLLSALE
ncbi:hypothetical protein NDU88_001781 [Pleurodeles waltl]|uniref:Uncharacterized protein n=1 Tax=Pleurodeles waltl TaxID=8319 RepID=A0AAV7P838_PLEWA|nr:hypothetical protein NDU88_001781 [Pleurodeles waltl]